MPLAIPPADLHASTSASHARATHVKLDDEHDEPLQSKVVSLDDAEYGGMDSKHIEDRPRRRGVRGKASRAMEFLVEHGVEARGIDPVPETERIELQWYSMVPQFTLWAAANTNILSFSAGALGPALFELPFKQCAACIFGFGALASLPPAYLATCGPRTGMRQMIQARFGFGYYPAMVFSLCNCATMIGFLSLNAILGGQLLSLASDSTMSWNVGIAVVGIISLLISFAGLRALHWYSMAMFPIMVILYIVIAAINGGKLSAALTAPGTVVTPGGILGYGASLLGFTVTYSSLASDFTTYLPPSAPRFPLFLCVFLGLFLPITLIQCLGAACELAARSYPDWSEGAAIGVADLLFAMVGHKGAGRFVMILLAFSVTANTSPTIYSSGFNIQILVPWLLRVPRYFLAVIITAIYIPIAIVGATHFYEALLNFLSVLAYWTALYLPPALMEPLIFRAPVSLDTYPLSDWNNPKRLPIGIAAVVSILCGVPVVTAGMSQTWWVGWIARKISDGYGDVAFEIGIVTVGVIYLPLRYLEKRYTGR